MLRVLKVFGAILAVFVMACESKSPAVQPEQQPLEGHAWTFVGEPDLKLHGEKVRVSRGRVETVITLLGGTTVITLRKRGEPTILWTQEDWAVIEIAMPGLHCFVSADGKEKKDHAFAVQFNGPDLSEATFHGEMPCTKGPDILKFSGSFKETP